MTPSEKANRQYWASRREQQPKPVVKLSVEDFVAEANRRLAAQTACVLGTRFLVIHPSPGAPRGAPTWEGPASMRSLIQRIVQDMTTHFEVEVPFRVERQ